MESNNLEMLKSKVQQKFSELCAALHMREKLLLRQLDVIANSQQMRRGTVATVATKDKIGEIKFLTDQEDELLAAIRCFGRYQLDNMNLALQDVYLQNEDYISPVDDHETMYKCLQQQDGVVGFDLDVEQPESIVVDFSQINKSLVEDNAKQMNKSIINITLQEAKELIRKAKVKRETYVPPLNLEELDDELESSIAEAVSSLGRETTKSSHTCVEQTNKSKSKKSRFKPKITINNCNGTINLRNIASLTINCANEESVSAEIPLEQPQSKIQSADSSTTEHSTPTTTTTSSSNYSSNASSRSQSKKQKQNSKKEQQQPAKREQQCTANTVTTTTTTNTKNTTAESTEPTSSSSGMRYADDDNDDINDSHVVTCDFYNRLLNEIKRSLIDKPTRTYDNHTHVQAVAADSTCDANSNVSSVQTSKSVTNTTSSNSQIQPGKRLVLKNFENLKIILEANSGDEDAFHPVQIEQWLAEIISETDLEPMQNTDILEHSKINSEST